MLVRSSAMVVAALLLGSSAANVYWPCTSAGVIVEAKRIGRRHQ